MSLFHYFIVNGGVICGTVDDPKPRSSHFPYTYPLLLRDNTYYYDHEYDGLHVPNVERWAVERSAGIEARNDADSDLEENFQLAELSILKSYFN